MDVDTRITNPANTIVWWGQVFSICGQHACNYNLDDLYVPQHTWSYVHVNTCQRPGYLLVCTSSYNFVTRRKTRGIPTFHLSVKSRFTDTLNLIIITRLIYQVKDFTMRNKYPIDASKGNFVAKLYQIAWSQIWYHLNIETHHICRIFYA